MVVAKKMWWPRYSVEGSSNTGLNSNMKQSLSGEPVYVGNIQEFNPGH
jgi:hypothetical protein